MYSANIARRAAGLRRARTLQRLTTVRKKPPEEAKPPDEAQLEQLPPVQQLRWRLWRLFEDPTSSKAAKYVSTFIMLVIVIYMYIYSKKRAGGVARLDWTGLVCVTVLFTAQKR